MWFRNIGIDVDQNPWKPKSSDFDKKTIPILDEVHIYLENGKPINLFDIDFGKLKCCSKDTNFPRNVFT